MVKVDDTAEFALVKHEYPYVDGADVEQMGRQARAISVEAVFYGPDYEARLKTFTDRLDGVATDNPGVESNPRGGWLQHPVFGMMFVQVGRYAIHHDDEPDYASVSIDFVESTPSQPFFAKQDPAQKAEAVSQQGKAAVAGAGEAAGKLIDRVRAANPLAPLDALREKMTAPLLGIVAQANLVLSGLDVLAYPRAWGNDVSSLVQGVLDIYNWADRLEADWQSICADLNSFSVFSTPPAVTPSQASSDTAPTEEQAIASVALTMQVSTAVVMADAAGFVLAAESSIPTMQPAQIEAICNTARSAIAAAIEQAQITYGIEQSRTITEPLKGQALAVQEAARAVIAARPPLIQRAVNAPGNMRLLAHLWYGDCERAPELFRLNGARSPFVNTGEVLNAYAR